MIAGGSEAAITPMGDRRLRGDAGDVDAERRTGDGPAGRSITSATGSSSARGQGSSCSKSARSALQRGAKIYAELVGYGMSADAFHITAPTEDGSGALRVMEQALSKARISPQQVGYINAHGTSTPHNDRIETLAIRNLFGDHAYRLAISSTKSMTGHLLGAAGGLEAGITALAVHHQTAPPTINFENPDPDCDLDYVPGKCRPVKMDYALSNSFGFGGTNAALLFSDTSSERLTAFEDCQPDWKIGGLLLDLNLAICQSSNLPLRES